MARANSGDQAAGSIAADRTATLELLASLTREYSEIVESARSVSTDDEHDPEGATIAYERAQVAALVSRTRDHLADLDHAEERLRAGTYGVCERCGNPIDPERLAARPGATTCITCASARR